MRRGTQVAARAGGATRHAKRSAPARAALKEDRERFASGRPHALVAVAQRGLHGRQHGWQVLGQLLARHPVQDLAQTEAHALPRARALAGHAAGQRGNDGGQDFVAHLAHELPKAARRHLAALLAVA